MKNRHAIPVLIAVSIGCISDTRTVPGTGNADRAIDSQQVESLETDLPTVKAIEGLPHQVARTFETERAKSNIHDILGHLFYDGPISLTDKDATQIKTVLETKSSYEPHTEKLCGGFHPDWAIEVNSGKTITVYLICFGCHEVIKLADTGHRRKYDLTDAAYKVLSSTLVKYHANLPQESRHDFMAEPDG